MGRGTSPRGLLPLLEAPTLSQENLLRLPFSDGGGVELRWDASGANLLVSQPLRLPKGVKTSMSLEAIASWLQSTEFSAFSSTTNVPASPRGSVSIGPFDVAWNPGDIGPGLFLYTSMRNSLLVGRAASWDVLRQFLQAAHTEDLF